jgi:hypothetical protein
LGRRKAGGIAGGACRKRGGKGEMYTKFWLDGLKTRDLSDGLAIVGDNIKMDLRDSEWKVVKWIRMNEDRDLWRDPEPSVYTKCWEFLDCLREYQLAASQGRLCSV